MSLLGKAFRGCRDGDSPFRRRALLFHLREYAFRLIIGTVATRRQFPVAFYLLFATHVARLYCGSAVSTFVARPVLELFPTSGARGVPLVPTQLRTRGQAVRNEQDSPSQSSYALPRSSHRGGCHGRGTGTRPGRAAGAATGHHRGRRDQRSGEEGCMSALLAAAVCGNRDRGGDDPSRRSGPLDRRRLVFRCFARTSHV